MSACEECWGKACAIAARTGQLQADLYWHLVRQPRSHCHGLDAAEPPVGQVLTEPQEGQRDE